MPGSDESYSPPPPPTGGAGQSKAEALMCRTCGKPAFPHPYRHPLVTMVSAVDPIEAASEASALADHDVTLERQRADKWMEDGRKYHAIRDWLRVCEDTPEGHAEFYRECHRIVFPDQEVD